MITTAPAKTAVIHSFEALREASRLCGPKRVGVVVADDEVALLAAAGVAELGLAVPVLIGDEPKIRHRIRELGVEILLRESVFIVAADSATAAATATRMARSSAT